ncbi:zinc knuckle CX2CX4HX4C containing protein [Tanacetum coccineum]
MPRGGNRSRDRGRRDNREFLHENRTKALDNKYQNGVFKSVRGGGPRTYRPVTKNNVEAPANNRRLEDGQVQFYHKVYACLVSAGGLCVVLQDVGGLGYARVLVEVNAEKKLVDQIEVLYKDRGSNEQFVKKIKVKYDWKPPICSLCKVFGHMDNNCAKMEKKEGNMKEVMKENNTGFINVM